MVMLIEWWDARNEADEPWYDVLRQLALLYPSMNSARYTLLSDMQKGIEKAAKATLPLMNRALCCDHMKANVIKVAGTAMLTVFEEAAFATRPDKFLKAMEKATPKLTNYLTVEHPKEEWAKLFHPGDMGGKMASSGVEAMNGADKLSGVRGMPIGLPMTEGLLVHSQKRFLARKKESMLANDSVVLPLVLKKLKKNLDKVVPAVLQVTFVDKDRTEVRLKMKKGAQVFTRVVQLGGPGGAQTCECGVFAIEKIPCGCLLHAAQKAGKPFSSLLDVSEKGSTFKMQYSDLPPFKVPGNEELADLEAENCLQPPAAFATKAGRPSFKRIKSAIEISTKQSKHAKKSTD